VPFGLLLCLAVVAILERRRRWPDGAWLLLAFIAVNLVSTLAFFCLSRHRTPAVPALCVLAGGGLRAIADRGRYSKSWLVQAAGVALGTSLTFLPGGDAMRYQAAMQWYCFGNEAFKHRNFEYAIQLYERALEIRKRTPDIYFNLAQARASLGDIAGAKADLDRVLELNPRDEQARALVDFYSKKLTQ
jgi:tetratricopeptide (TPR) repeat protein